MGRAHVQAQLDEWLPRLFGYHMLKLGGLSCELTTGYCNIRHQVHVDLKNPVRNMEAELHHLPFTDKAFDVCILANQLDFCQDPHRLLREIDRVMIDDGYLIVSGVNPASIMGVGALLPWRKNKMPWNGRMFTPYRIRDWLGVLNYQVMETTCIGLFPSTKNRTWGAWMEGALMPGLSGLASMYFIVCRKRTYPLKPIKPKWKVRKGLAPIGANF